MEITEFAALRQETKTLYVVAYGFALEALCSTKFAHLRVLRNFFMSSYELFSELRFVFHIAVASARSWRRKVVLVFGPS